MPNVENYKKIFIFEQNQFGKGWAQNVARVQTPLFQRMRICKRNYAPGHGGMKDKERFQHLCLWCSVGGWYCVTGLLCGHLYFWVYLYLLTFYLCCICILYVYLVQWGWYKCSCVTGWLCGHYAQLHVISGFTRLHAFTSQSFEHSLYYGFRYSRIKVNITLYSYGFTHTLHNCGYSKVHYGPLHVIPV